MSPHFDVASIRLTNLNTDDDSTSDHVEISPGGRLTMRSIRLNSCVKWAYGVQDAQIVDRVGLTAERYDIVAQAAGPTADKNLKLMMQALLADRFKLALHREKKELAIYKLVVAKSGPKFRKSEGAGNREGNLEIRRTRVGVAAEKISMSEFADYLSGEVQGPVQDMTGLTGSFNLALDLRPYAANLSTPVTISSLILEAMRDQLGLQLQSQKGLTDVLVIDHVERPTAN
jgi:uncharacterized protein (TIGR03435 family)